MTRINNLKIRFPTNSELTQLEVKAKILSSALGKNFASTIPYIDSINKRLDANEKMWAKNQKHILTCVKGKTTKIVTGISPKCPTGYKKK